MPVKIQLMAICPKTAVNLLGLNAKQIQLMTSDPLHKYYPNPLELRLHDRFAKYSWQKHIMNFERVVPVKKLMKYK